jgi:hypothetical protein
MNTNTFEDYLMEVHATTYHGTDDDMPDNYEAWVGQLDASAVMQYADACVTQLNEKYKASIDIGLKAVTELQKVGQMAKSINQ